MIWAEKVIVEANFSFGLLTKGGSGGCNTGGK